MLTIGLMVGLLAVLLTQQYISHELIRALDAADKKKEEEQRRYDLLERLDGIEIKPEDLPTDLLETIADTYK